MGTGYFLRIGDKTTCGGRIISGCDCHSIEGVATARVGDKYICGQDGKPYHIASGIPDYIIMGVSAAGTAHSVGTCGCRCHFISSCLTASYGYESETEKKFKATRAAAVQSMRQPSPPPAPKTVVAPPAPAPAPKPKEEPRTPVDAGFCVLPFGATPKSYDPWFFVNPPEGVRDLFLQLNPDRQKKPGSILIVVDPEKKDQDQIQTLQRARDRIDTALEPLTVEEAKLLHDNRAAIDIFSSQVYSDALGTSGDIFGYISEAGKSYYEEIKNILEEIQKLYQNTYSHNNGIISGQEFFGQRQRLFDRLNVVLNRYLKSQLNLREYEDIKRALGLSTSSIMHRWDQTGVRDIEGYANYIEKSAKLIKIMRTTGYIGIGLDFASYSSNVYEACAKGREDECRKAAITEYSKFGTKQGLSITAGTFAGRAATSSCMWVLGLATSEVGGVGAALCLMTGVGVGIGIGKISEEYGENAGEYIGGHIIYDKIINSGK